MYKCTVVVVGIYIYVVGSYIVLVGSGSLLLVNIFICSYIEVEVHTYLYLVLVLVPGWYVACCPVHLLHAPVGNSLMRLHRYHDIYSLQNYRTVMEEAVDNCLNFKI